MPDAPSFPTLPVLDTHAAPDGATAGGVVYRTEHHEPLRREVALRHTAGGTR